MRTDLSTSEWQRYRNSVREEWGRITEDDLDYIAGQRERLAERLQSHYGFSPEAAEGQIDHFERHHARPDDGWASAGG